MKEAQPLLPRNVDEIIKQPANNAEENPSLPNDLSSNNKFLSAIRQHLLETQKGIVFMDPTFWLMDNLRLARQHVDLMYY
jgi:hypothetical protein